MKRALHQGDVSFSRTGRGTLSRRQFVKRVSGGLLFLLSSSNCVRGEQLPSTYLKVAEDGTFTLFSAKVELGQGAMTSLAQIVAEELDVPLASMSVIGVDTSVCPPDPDGGTFGSYSMRNLGPVVRLAAARARGLLVQLASAQLNLPKSELMTQDGFVLSRTDPKVRISYAELAGGKLVQATLTDPAKVQDLSQFTLCGKPALRLDALEKVTGRAQYTADVRLPGMLYARILRPPARGATLKSVDTSAAVQVAGARVVHTGDFVAVLHEQPDLAERAFRLVKAEFNGTSTEPNEQTIYEYLVSRAAASRTLGQRGDLAAGERLAAVKLEQTYYTPYVAHVPLEPHAAVATIDAGRLTIWSSTQTPFSDRTALGASRVVAPYVGGAFGGKISTTQAASEAARLARAVGAPVSVAWTREEEFFYDDFQCPSIIKIRAGLGADGHMTYWDNQVYYVDERGASFFYDIPNHRTRLYGTYTQARPFAGGAWRGPGNSANTFARESHVNALAAAAVTDPVEFRLQHLKDTRMRHLLEQTAEAFGWPPAKASNGRGYGVACGQDAGTYMTMMAEVTVDQETGEIRVVRVLSAQDMGRVINPDGARLQMEGGVMMGLGYSLVEELHFVGSRIKDLNFLSYSIPRFSWLPKIETLLVPNDSLPPQGGGEPPVVAVGATLANAVFDAIGVQLNRLPMTPERVLTALRQSQNLILNRPERSGDQLVLSWKGGPGIKLQYSPSLSNPSWQDVPNTAGASSASLPASDRAGFFRLVRAP